MDRLSTTITVTEAKRRFLELVDDIEHMRNCVTITKNGIPTTVMLSLDDYESLLETLEILANPKIMASLKKSRAQIKKRNLLDDSEVWD